MTRLNIACTAFASLAEAHLFSSSEKTIREYYNRITRTKSKQHAIRDVCGEVSKSYTFKSDRDAKKIIRQIQRDHKVKLACARSVYFKCRGIAVEPKCRRLYAEKTDQNFSRVHERCKKIFDVFTLQGEIDGVCNGRVIELKARAGKFYFEPPYHDIIQLACYCVCLGLPGTLAEFDRDFRLRATKLSLCKAEEIIETLLPSVRRNVYLLYKCLELGTSDLALIGAHMETFRAHPADPRGVESQRLLPIQPRWAHRRVVVPVAPHPSL